MRKLSPTKAITHALNSVWTYREVALRIALPWLPVLLLTSLLELYFAPPDVTPGEIPGVTPIQIATVLVSLIVTSSLAVSWQRFILRDEVSRGLRLDANVLYYALFSFLLVMLAVIPTAVLLTMAILVPAVAVLAVPAFVLIAGVITRLSVRFPAIALGDRTFSFRDAWAASAGNMWQCIAVFLLSWAITLGGLFVLILMGSALAQVSGTLGQLFTAIGLIVMQLFYAILNASVFTSLYGFFVERREF